MAAAGGTAHGAGGFGNFRSLDAGQSFSPMSILPLGFAQRLQGMSYATIPGFLLFGTSRGVLRSTDNGDNFSVSNSGLGVAGSLPASISDVLLRPGSVSRAVAFSLSADVFASNDGGASWVVASGGLVRSDKGHVLGLMTRASEPSFRLRGSCKVPPPSRI
jgi:hypothetical protein